MDKAAVIVVFDIGKTNKKLFLFDEAYHVVLEETDQLPEIIDEDGFACEDVHGLTAWVKRKFSTILENEKYEIRGVNFSAYGASFVYLDEAGEVMLPLYNYLKAFPGKLNDQFYGQYGGQSTLCRQTASPALGSLNAGLQLYRLKYEKAALFKKIKFALHLPNYLSYILSRQCHSELTSIGCHTHLWNFEENRYHVWVEDEGLSEKFPSIRPASFLSGMFAGKIPVGVGLHDSSAALIPYICTFTEPFILLSTGTWCITLNPFNETPLTNEELENDCLCYLTFKGQQVKASRLFAGNEHELHVKRLAEYFQKSADYFRSVSFDHSFLSGRTFEKINKLPGSSAFENRDISMFSNYEEAYHWLMFDIVSEQIASTNLVLQNSLVNRIFVDGGFSRNPIFMNLLADAYPSYEVYAASVAQASAIGAALAFHEAWNRKAKPKDMIAMNRFFSTPDRLAGM